MQEAQRPASVPPVARCRCACGYTCAGPGGCALYALDPLSCFEQHWRKDCDHDFGNPLLRFTRGRRFTVEPVACSRCGMTEADHEEACGP